MRDRSYRRTVHASQEANCSDRQPPERTRPAELRLGFTVRLALATRLPDHTPPALPARNVDPLARIRYGFYVIYLAFALGFNDVALVTQTFGAGTPSYALYNASWYVAHAAAVLLFLLTVKQNATNALIALSVGVFFAASALWSPTPSSTLLACGILIINILVAHLIANDLDLRGVLLLATRVIAVLAAVGLVCYAVGWSQVLYYDPGGRLNIFGLEPFRGFFVHKIRAALYATVGLIGVLVLYRGAKRVLLAAMLALFVLLTGSATGLVTLAIAVAVLVLTLAAARHRVRPAAFLSIGGCIAAVGGAVLVQYWDQILAVLGRDETLTGRTILWEFGIDAWRERWLGGWGYSAYFRTEHAEQLSTVSVFSNYDVPHFHNSYIQTGVDFGIVGVAFLILLLCSVLIRSYVIATTSDSNAGAGAFAITLTFAVTAMTMIIFIDRNHFATILLFALYFASRRDRKGHSITPSRTS